MFFKRSATRSPQNKRPIKNFIAMTTSLNPYLSGLLKSIAQNPGKLAIENCANNHLTSVKELWHSSVLVARTLSELQIQKGSHVVVTIKPSEAYCKIVYGIFLHGAIPVFLDPGMPSPSLDACIDELAPSLWVSDSTENNPAAVLPSLLITSEIGDRQLNEPELIKYKSTDTCLIIYTTGTTGLPKGVPWTHGNVQSHLIA